MIQGKYEKSREATDAELAFVREAPRNAWRTTTPLPRGTHSNKNPMQMQQAATMEFHTTPNIQMK